MHHQLSADVIIMTLPQAACIDLYVAHHTSIAPPAACRSHAQMILVIACHCLLSLSITAYSAPMQLQVSARRQDRPVQHKRSTLHCPLGAQLGKVCRLQNPGLPSPALEQQQQQHAADILQGPAGQAVTPVQMNQS